MKPNNPMRSTRLGLQQRIERQHECRVRLDVQQDVARHNHVPGPHVCRDGHPPRVREVVRGRHAVQPEVLRDLR